MREKVVRGWRDRYMQSVHVYPQPGRPEAANAIWIRSAKLRVSADVGRRASLRVVSLAVVAVVLHVIGWRFAAMCTATMGIVTLMLGWCWPKAFERIEALLDTSAQAVGVALSWVLLLPVYFLFVTPLGWFTRSARVKKMGLDFCKGAGTNWTPRTTSNLERPY